MKSQSSPYVEQQYRQYSLYVMTDRAIPTITDGLKISARRVLWTARDGKKIKTASLAGATMPIHPHGDVSGTICTLTAPHGNNIPLFDGDGAFGTLLEPKAYGAPRYTYVTLSQFAKDALLTDLDIVPLQENYDKTTTEPTHLLPLVPIVLLNPTSGSAVGFATNILPRDLDDIISGQIQHLSGKKITSPLTPTFYPLNNKCHEVIETERGTAYCFKGEYTLTNNTMVIHKLPYGITHKELNNKIDKLYEKNHISSVLDNSRTTINVTIKFNKSYIESTAIETIENALGLSTREIENLNILNFDGQSIVKLTPVEIVKQFTDWRLQFYTERYKHLLVDLNKQIQRCRDIITAIDNDVGALAKKIKDRSSLIEKLIKFGIVDVDYIASLPVYRFTKEEYQRVKVLLEQLLGTSKQYQELIDDINKCKLVYIKELKEIQTKLRKGTYTGTKK